MVLINAEAERASVSDRHPPGFFRDLSLEKSDGCPLAATGRHGAVKRRALRWRVGFVVEGGHDMTGGETTPGPVQLQGRFFDDYVPGSVAVFGAEPVSEAEILDFAARFDPQSIHTDPTAAAGVPFNGLIASGWHTMALMMRILVRYYLNDAASLASPGVDESPSLPPRRAPGGPMSCHLEGSPIFSNGLR